MKIINSVFNLANEFMKFPEYVEINYDGCNKTVEKINECGSPVKYFEKDDDLYGTVKETVLKQLVGNSINYCYWYGTCDIRPNNCSSTEMWKAVETAFNKGKDPFFLLKSELARRRFPLLEQRCKHITEIHRMKDLFIAILLEARRQGQDNLYPIFDMLVQTFPGYASDMFLKRASLFFMMLHRIFGWYEKDLHKLHIPADYQVPKMLEDLDCIRYSEDLFNAVSNNQLIPAHSRAECEIRAASILVCKYLGKKTGLNASDIDWWLWSKRKECNNDFHLTITTDY